MKYQRYDLNSYNLHLIKTTKFKTVSVLISFKRPIIKEETTIRSMLPLMLLNSTKEFPSTRLLNIEAERQYGLNLSYNQRRLGNYNVLTFSLNMINEKWTEKGMFEKNLAFLFDVLFNPNINNDEFDSKSFNIVQNILYSKLQSIKDDISKYGIVRMLEEMDEKSPISYRVGYLDDVIKIDEKKLYNYYTNMIKSDDIDVLVLGDIDPIQTKRIFKKAFLINTIKRNKSDIIIEHTKLRRKLKKVIEKESIKQAKLTVGFKTMKLSEYERKYVMPIYSRILGGPSYSKLFRTVREKNSLAYYIACNYSMPDNLLLVYSGINKENFDPTLQLIKKEVQNMNKGNITEEEIDNAKKDVISLYDTIEDNASQSINYYLSKELLELDDLKTRKKLIKEVTIDDLKKVSKKIKIDTAHLLYGDDNDEKNKD